MGIHPWRDKRRSSGIRGSFTQHFPGANTYCRVPMRYQNPIADRRDSRSCSILIQQWKQAYIQRSLGERRGADSAVGVVLGSTIRLAGRSVWHSLDDQLWEEQTSRFVVGVKSPSQVTLPECTRDGADEPPAYTQRLVALLRVRVQVVITFARIRRAGKKRQNCSEPSCHQ